MPDKSEDAAGVTSAVLYITTGDTTSPTSYFMTSDTTLAVSYVNTAGVQLQLYNNA